MWYSPLLRFLREDQTSVCHTCFQHIFFCLRLGLTSWNPFPSYTSVISFFIQMRNFHECYHTWASKVQSVFPIQIPEASEIYYTTVVRLLVYLAQIISGKQKAASFTVADNIQKWTNDDWKYRASKKEIVKDSKEKKWLKTKLQQRKNTLA